MFKKYIFKITLLLLLTHTSSYACPIYENPIPMADVNIDIDAKKSKTSFNITWQFKEFFIQELLLDHDINKNGKFDKNEQEDIKNELIAYIEKNNYITEIVYVKKGQRVKKSLMSKINPIKSKLSFSDDGIKYSYSFDTDFILENNHRLFIRFLDSKEKVHIIIKGLHVNNYSSKKVIVTQDIRASVYFYDFKPKHLN